MMQLVGYRSWNASGASRTIDAAAVRRGVALAQEELEHRVFDATLAELSKGDLAFLLAMARDEGPVRRDVIAERLGRSSSYVSTYKKRLLEAGVIEEPESGVLAFALPGFRENVRRRA